MKEGDRVVIQTRNFKGSATVIHIAVNEFYPVQVELDQPDSDGHKVVRVSFIEILQENQRIVPLEQPVNIEQSLSSGTNDLRQMSFFDLL